MAKLKAMKSLQEVHQEKLQARKCDLHIYQRTKIDREIFRCIAPYCAHRERKEFLVGKAAKCPKCGGEYIMERIQLKSSRNPVCIKCSKSPKAALLKVAENVMGDIFTEIGKAGEGTSENE